MSLPGEVICKCASMVPHPVLGHGYPLPAQLHDIGNAYLSAEGWTEAETAETVPGRRRTKKSILPLPNTFEAGMENTPSLRPLYVCPRADKRTERYNKQCNWNLFLKHRFTFGYSAAALFTSAYNRFF